MSASSSSGFQGWMLDLFALIPDHCFSFHVFLRSILFHPFPITSLIGKSIKLALQNKDTYKSENQRKSQWKP